ncbi:hypothetical protein C0075_06515 [Rhizobium sp. KAs_5_22]|nr:hypothetical protein C0075_06515 [Rhizobium sp. KAs_5_22]
MPRVVLGIINARKGVATIDQQEVFDIEGCNRQLTHQSRCRDMEVLPETNSFRPRMRYHEIAEPGIGSQISPYLGNILSCLQDGHASGDKPLVPGGQSNGFDGVTRTKLHDPLLKLDDSSRWDNEVRRIFYELQDVRIWLYLAGFAQDACIE